MRVERTFAFLDLSGFTAYTDTHGDDAAVAALARLRTVLRATSERRGVRITKWLGDGAMLSGIDPHEVVHCAAEVLAHVTASGPLPLRGGVARGPVIMFEGDDYVGFAVNLAARLCRVAPPNHLLATADAIDAAQAPGLAIVPRTDIAVDGLKDMVSVVDVRVSSSDPPGGGRPVPRNVGDPA